MVRDVSIFTVTQGPSESWWSVLCYLAGVWSLVIPRILHRPPLTAESPATSNFPRRVDNKTLANGCQKMATKMATKRAKNLKRWSARDSRMV